MGKNKLVSIIVPVYNVEPYLEKCLDSILNQSYGCFEIILINDGSTDKSGIICEKYAGSIGDIKLIHQENMGISKARNEGLSLARGSYIQFVDSDDFIEKKMTESLVNHMRDDADLVMCGYNRIRLVENKYVTENRCCTVKKKYININSENYEWYFDLYEKKYLYPVWNKLYKASIVKTKNLSFEEKVKREEDILFNLRYINYCRRLCLVDRALYNYIKYNPNAITKTFHRDKHEVEKLKYDYKKQFFFKRNAYVGDIKKRVELQYASGLIKSLDFFFDERSDNTFKKQYYMAKKIIRNRILQDNLGLIKKSKRWKLSIGLMIKLKFTPGIILAYKMRNLFKYF
jgi:glycosyltransferase involved in cell wall biosynthesis